LGPGGKRISMTSLNLTQSKNTATAARGEGAKKGTSEKSI